MSAPSEDSKATVNGDELKTDAHAPSEDEIKNLENTSSSLPSDFSLERLRTSFEGCIAADGKILLKNYITGFEELYKFLNLLGTVFGWVSTDVDNKMGRLTKYLPCKA